MRLNENNIALGRDGRSLTKGASFIYTVVCRDHMRRLHERLIPTTSRLSGIYP